MVVEETPDGQFVRKITKKSLDELPAGEVLIKVMYSSLNYKDALSASGNKGVTKSTPTHPELILPVLWKKASAMILRLEKRSL